MSAVKVFTLSLNDNAERQVQALAELIGSGYEILDKVTINKHGSIKSVYLLRK